MPGLSINVFLFYPQYKQLPSSPPPQKKSEIEERNNHTSSQKKKKKVKTYKMFEDS